MIAHYGDGTTRDVSKVAVLQSNSTSTVKIQDGSTVVGERIGEAAIMVRYEGKFVTVPLTVLNPAPGFAWKQLPQNNFIDERIDAKLERLKIQPSPSASDEDLRPAHLFGPDRHPAHSGAGPWVHRGSRFLFSQARPLDRQLDRKPGLCRLLVAEMGRPAPIQPQAPRREGHVGVPPVDPGRDRVEPAVRRFRPANCSRQWAARSSPRQPTTTA